MKSITFLLLALCFAVTAQASNPTNTIISINLDMDTSSKTGELFKYNVEKFLNKNGVYASEEIQTHNVRIDYTFTGEANLVVNTEISGSNEGHSIKFDHKCMAQTSPYLNYAKINRFCARKVSKLIARVLWTNLGTN